MNYSSLMDRGGWVWRLLFWPASLLYGAAVKARSAAYARGWMETVRLPVPVLCVGNITVGGSGKTPGVIWLAEYLLKKGRKPAVITRGYGARGGAAVRVVSGGKGPLMPAPEAGDEPFLMSRRLPGVPILTGADRAVVGRWAVEEFGVDVLLMDDGYQHLRLHRNLNLLCVDATEVPSMFEPGGAALLPAGRLRESLSALWRADLLLLTRAEIMSADRLAAVRKKMESYLLDVPVVPVFGLQTFLRHGTGEPVEESFLRGRGVLAVSGLARPSSFEHALRKKGMFVTPLRFPDHHFFTEEDRRKILSRAEQRGLEVVVTEKDAVRLPDDFPCIVARLEWSPQDTRVREKGDTTPLPRTVLWTQRIDSVIASNT